ncbi:MAG: DMT family transporter [Chloroflexi bacterium]|nr:MAG: DMT family transporter [Chloroflexota bacterium]
MTSARRARGAPSANLALVGATLAVSCSAVLIRIAGDDPATVVWLRMAMATVLLAPFVWRDVRRGVVAHGARQLSLVGVSGLLLAAHFLLWTASLRYTSIAASVLLVSLHPVMVSPLGRRLFGERTTAGILLGMGLALGGTVVTCVADLRFSTTALAGDLLALGGAASLAGYLVIGRGVRSTLGVAGYSGSVYAIVAVVAAATSVAGGVAHMPGARVTLVCLALAAVCTIGGHTVYNWALRHVQALKVSIAFLGEPPLAALLAAAVFQSIPSLTTVAGGVLILAGLAITMRRPSGIATTTLESVQ